MATVAALIQADNIKPNDIEIEIQNTINARRKLQNLITGLNKQFSDAELVFMKEFSRDLAALKVDFDRAFVDANFTKYTLLKQNGEQILQHIAALEEIASKNEKRIDEYKKINRDELKTILKRDLEKLVHDRADQEKETDVLDAEICRLENEISQLEGVGQSKASSPQVETSQRLSKGKE